MDFHHDGKVSCLEFQEVISGQERYCSLREARSLFCLLARGTSGWLTWENFQTRLEAACQDAVEVTAIDLDAVSWSCASSESSRLAGQALRAFVLGDKSVACDKADPENDADEAATTVHSFTSRSTQSIPRLSSCQAASSRTPVTQTMLSAPGCPPSEAHGIQLQARGFSPNEIATRLLQGALNTRSLNDFGRLASGCAFDQPPQARSSSGVIDQLDLGLASLRAEIAALRSMGAPVPDEAREVETGFHTAGIRDMSEDHIQRFLLGSPVQEQEHSTSLLNRPFQTTARLQVGLAWMQQLPAVVQGKLAACIEPAEALDVLDEALDTCPPRQEDEVVKNTADEISAAMTLLQLTQQKVSTLEVTLAERRQKNAQEVACLRDHLQEERKTTLRRLLSRLAPPSKHCPTSSFQDSSRQRIVRSCSAGDLTAVKQS